MDKVKINRNKVIIIIGLIILLVIVYLMYGFTETGKENKRNKIIENERALLQEKIDSDREQREIMYRKRFDELITENSNLKDTLTELEQKYEQDRVEVEEKLTELRSKEMIEEDLNSFKRLLPQLETYLTEMRAMEEGRIKTQEKIDELEAKKEEIMAKRREEGRGDEPLSVYAPDGGDGMRDILHELNFREQVLDYYTIKSGDTRRVVRVNNEKHYRPEKPDWYNGGTDLVSIEEEYNSFNQFIELYQSELDERNNLENTINRYEEDIIGVKNKIEENIAEMDRIELGVEEAQLRKQEESNLTKQLNDLELEIKSEEYTGVTTDNKIQETIKSIFKR